MSEKKRAGAVISVKREKSGEGKEYLSFKLHAEGEADKLGGTPVVEELRFDPSLCSAKVRKHAEWHGWEQRLRDAAAKPRDLKTGKSAKPEEKFAAIRKLAEWYLSGAEQWNLNRGPGGGAQQRAGDDKQMLKAALGEYLPTVGKVRTVEQIHEAVEKMEKAEVSSLLANAKIAAIVLRLREEKAMELEIDAEELLEGI